MRLAQEDTSPTKIDVTSKSPVGDISVVTLIRTDTGHLNDLENIYIPITGISHSCQQTWNWTRERKGFMRTMFRDMLPCFSVDWPRASIYADVHLLYST